MASLPVPDGIDLSESRVASIIGALSCTWALAAIAVVLRFLARRIQSNKLWLEDWLITVSLVCNKKPWPFDFPTLLDDKVHEETVHVR